MTKLSDIAWEKSAKVVHAIKQHPFNQELAQGSLAIDKFAYYVEQDTLYLQDFARALALIAGRAPVQYIRNFLSFSDGALIAEQEVVHSFFKEMFNFTETGKITPALMSYTSYLIKECSTGPLEVAIASVLPCFWVYQEVGLSIVKSTSPSQDNPYLRWIETYSSEEFGDIVKKAIEIFDAVAATTTDEVREQMVDAFYKSTVHEWHFWNDAYHKAEFDGFAA